MRSFREIIDPFMAKKIKEKPINERIDDAVAADTIRKYMYLNRNIDFLIFYKKGEIWNIAKKPAYSISKGIEEKLKDIFSHYVKNYESLYNGPHFKLDKVKYTSKKEICTWVVDLEFSSRNHCSFMTTEYVRIINDKIRKSMER